VRLHESNPSHLWMTRRLSDFIQSTNRVKQGCPLSQTLFGIYIDKMESFLHEHIQEEDGCFLHQVLISLLFIDDLILLASTLEDLQRHIDDLTIFCDLPQLTINLGKTKVMIFNASKSFFSNRHFYFQEEEIEITRIYTYLGVQVVGPHFHMHWALHPWLSKGYSSLTSSRNCVSRTSFKTSCPNFTS
jgi:hypothetical protein